MISQSCGVGFWYFRLVSTLVTIGILASSESSVLAQIREDNTLGTESSVVTPTIVNGQVINQIDGGATRGTNLFHSFEQFSVVRESTAYFNRKYGVSRQKILTFQSSLDLSQYKLRGENTSAQSTQSSTENLPKELTPIQTSSVYHYPCLGPDLQPDPDYPDGCWVG
jgi:large exoprotein involved in heme utilization and adhesion